MIAQRRIGRITVACGNGRHDCGMFQQRIPPPPLCRDGGIGQQGHRPVHKVKLLHQKPVVRGQMDLLVEPPVGTAQGAGIIDQRLIGFKQVAQHPHFFGCGMAGGQTCRQPFQLAAHHVQFGQLVVIERGHNQRPPVAGQQRLRFQPLQSLADRRARYTKPLGQFAFHQPVAGAVCASVNRLKDQRIGVLLRAFGFSHRSAFRAGATLAACHAYRQAKLVAVARPAD